MCMHVVKALTKLCECSEVFAGQISIKLISFERRELEMDYFLLAYISILRCNMMSIWSVEYCDKIILAMGPLLNTMTI